MPPPDPQATELSDALRATLHLNANAEADDPLSDERLEQLVPASLEDPTLRDSLQTLRDLQTEHDQFFADYLREKQELEDRYEARFAPLFDRRKARLDEHPISLFWFKAFEHCEALRENITDKDAVALKYLTDVSCETVTMAKAAQEGVMPGLTVGSFVLSFRFADNPFFENDVLTKTYIMHEDDFEELEGTVGSKVLWKPGKDLTVRTLKKKTKNGRVLIKKTPTDSFFNFFSPPQGISEAEDEADPQLIEELEDVLEADFELGECIRSDVIPRALLYYLNIAEADDDDEDEDEDDGEEDESEDAGDPPNGREENKDYDADNDDDDDDEEMDGRTKHTPLPPPAQSVEECKQQ